MIARALTSPARGLGRHVQAAFKSLQSSAHDDKAQEVYLPNRAKEPRLSTSFIYFHPPDPSSCNLIRLTAHHRIVSAELGGGLQNTKIHTQVSQCLMEVEVMTEEAKEGVTQAPGTSAAAAPAQQDVHRPLLRVDRTGGLIGARHFLLPVDDTEDSEQALQWAVDNVYRSGDIFHLLHVIPEPKMVHIWAGVYIPPDEDAELVEVEDTKEFVKHRFAKTLIAAQVPFQLHVIVGPTDPEAVARLIAKKVKDLNTECVIMSRHSKGKLKEYWVGSVTKALIRLAPGPIAVVPHLG